MTTLENRPQVLIVEDDIDTREYLVHVLRAEFDVIPATSAEHAMEIMVGTVPDAVLVDIMMPGENGISLCHRLRSLGRPDLPIIMLSALNNPETRIQSFEAGADDYIAKPIGSDELCTRIMSRLKRINQVASGPGGKMIVVGNLSIDLERVEARVDSEKLQLGPVEFRILCVLAKSPGKMRQRKEIEGFVWGDDKPASRALDPHINALRKKLSKSQVELRTVYGAGYALSLRPSGPAPSSV